MTRCHQAWQKSHLETSDLCKVFTSKGIDKHEIGFSFENNNTRNKNIIFRDNFGKVEIIYESSVSFNTWQWIGSIFPEL